MLPFDQYESQANLESLRRRGGGELPLLPQVSCMERPATFTGLSIHLECEADGTTAMNPRRSILAGAVTASIVDSTCFCQGGKKEAVSFVEKCWHSWEKRDICAVVMLDKNS